MACTIAALPCPLDVLTVPSFLQQLPTIPFQAAALIEFWFFAMGETPRYGISKMLSAIVNQVHVAQQLISLTGHIFLLNLPNCLDPKGRTMNGESIVAVSASQIVVKNQQGLKQQTKQTNHGNDHEMVKLWCIGTVVVGISML